MEWQNALQEQDKRNILWVAAGNNRQTIEIASVKQQNNKNNPKIAFSQRIFKIIR